ncbi:FG-GAP-like repeat-containing protein [Paenarthrobacter sp. NPDC091711]|uniref:FG-GAP-like repeat-containing protein n=1 Tax=Paenarthrobacter sp. NPDC091711 TaxID=3364385 RepID=UPI0037F2826A
MIFSTTRRKNPVQVFRTVATAGALAGLLVAGSAGAGVARAGAAGSAPLHHIDMDGIVSMVGMPYVGSELRMGAPAEFFGCDKTQDAPDGYTIEWLSNGTPLPPERQNESLKILPEDRGNRLSFNVYATTPEKAHCGDSLRGDENTPLHSEETAPISASNRAMGWTGRGNFELMGRTDHGDLVLYPRTYTYGLGPCDAGLCPSYETAHWDKPRLVGTGWNIFDIVFSPGDFDGDGNNDVLGRDDEGELYLYPGDGSGGWKDRSVVGTGWNIFDTILGPGDFDKDGINDVVARDAEGDLHLYPGDGDGGWEAPSVVGTGWHIFDRIIAAGDLSGDGNVDVLGRDYDGYMHHYRTNSSGGWEGANTWGPGWGSMVDILGAGSYTHNLGEAIHWGHTVTRNDTVAIDANGDLLKYSGFVPTPQTIGTGWDIFTSLV